MYHLVLRMMASVLRTNVFPTLDTFILSSRNMRRSPFGVLIPRLRKCIPKSQWSPSLTRAFRTTHLFVVVYTLPRVLSLSKTSSHVYSGASVAALAVAVLAVAATVDGLGWIRHDCCEHYLNLQPCRVRLLIENQTAM